MKYFYQTETGDKIKVKSIPELSDITLTCLEVTGCHRTQGFPRGTRFFVPVLSYALTIRK